MSIQKVTGEYTLFYDFVGGYNETIQLGQPFRIQKDLQLPKGLWLVEIDVILGVQNVSVMTQLKAEGAQYPGGGVSNSNCNPGLNAVTLKCRYDQVRVSTTNPQEFNIFLTAGPGSGRLLECGVNLIAWKLAGPKARKQKKTTEKN